MSKFDLPWRQEESHECMEHHLGDKTKPSVRLQVRRLASRNRVVRIDVGVEVSAEQADAVAALLLAAPDIFDALVAAKAHIIGSGQTSHQWTMDTIDAALAKAIPKDSAP